MLINADLFACGIATLIQTLGLPGVGIRLPVMMGVTFAVGLRRCSPWRRRPASACSASLASVIVAGIFGHPRRAVRQPAAAAVPAGRHRHDHPVIGISLMRVGVNWAGGGCRPKADLRLGGAVSIRLRPVAAARHRAVRAGGDPRFIKCGRASRRMSRCCSASSSAASSPPRSAGWISTSVARGAVGRRGLCRSTSACRNSISSPILTMCIVMIVVMIESTGMFLALGEMTGRTSTQTTSDARPARRRPRHAHRRHLQHLPLYLVLAERRPGRRHRRASRWVTRRRRRHHAGARPDARSSSRWSPRSRSACSAAPASSCSAWWRRPASHPGDSRLRRNRQNLFMVAISIGFGLIPIVSPQFFKSSPEISEADARLRHPARDDRRRRAERLFQSRLSPRGWPHHRPACSTGCRSCLSFAN